MEPDLREWLDAEAARTGQNRSAYVRRLIEREREHQTSDRIAALERRIDELHRMKVNWREVLTKLEKMEVKP